MFTVQHWKHVEKNKEENSNPMTFHTWTLLPVWFLSLVLFCNEPESTVMTVAVSFFMGCHRTKQVCLDIMGGHIYISCVWTSFFASSPHPPKKYLYFPLRTKNKISQHAKSTFWEWAWLCLEHQEGRQQSNLSEEMLLLWRFLNRMTNSLGPVVLYIWDSSSYKVKNNYNVYELNFTCEMSRI